MQVVGAERIDAFRTVVHLVAEAPEPVPLVRAAVVPVVQKLIDQDPGERAAPGAERRAVDQAPRGKHRSPRAAYRERNPEHGKRHRGGAPAPTARRIVAPRAPETARERAANSSRPIRAALQRASLQRIAMLPRGGICLIAASSLIVSIL